MSNSAQVEHALSAVLLVATRALKELMNDDVEPHEAMRHDMTDRLYETARSDNRTSIARCDKVSITPCSPSPMMCIRR